MNKAPSWSNTRTSRPGGDFGWSGLGAGPGPGPNWIRGLARRRANEQCASEAP